MPTTEEINGLITVLETANSESEEDKIQAALWLDDYIKRAARKEAESIATELAQGAY